MGKRISEYDWTQTPLGHPDTWSEALKSTVRMMLVNRFPMLLWWGKAYIQLYNDPCIPVLGLKHLSGLGHSGYACWGEVWDVIGPLIDAPFNGGPASWMDDLLLKVNRNNFVEETHFTICCSPLSDPTVPSGIGGVLGTISEITDQVIGNRRMETLRKLGKGISTTLSAEQVYEQATAVAFENGADIPFIFIHKIAPASHTAVLTSAAGISMQHPEIPASIDLDNPGAKWRGLTQAAVDFNIVVEAHDFSHTDVPTGPWDVKPHHFAHLPIREGKRSAPVAIVTVALNPYRKYDDGYANFLQLMADQISFGVTNAAVYEGEKKHAEGLLSAHAGEEATVDGLALPRVHKGVEKALRFSEAQLRALVTATSDVIYRMNADWSEMRQLDGRNFLQDTGESIPNWQDKYIHPKDRARVTQAIAEAIRSKSVFQLEHQVIRADGTLGWTFSRAVPILDRKGNIIEWFGAASDISSRKLHEANLEVRVEDHTRELNKAHAALQTSNDDLQQFAHVASHDLKEPVRKIKTFTNRLLDDDQNRLSENSKVYVDKILSSADRMSTMIDGVLTYSSLNGVSVETTLVNLNDVIDNVKVDLELLIQQKNAVIRHQPLPSIRGGKVLLYQLFYNLISNALKFSHPDRAPDISITTQHSQRQGVPMHTITITDNGIGFEARHQEKIFETFTRLNSKDRFDGTGLGLTLCRKIVARHHGAIYATGIDGHGSSFMIELPEMLESSVV